MFLTPARRTFFVIGVLLLSTPGTSGTYRLAFDRVLESIQPVR
jgi:hypothetical protein